MHLSLPKWFPLFISASVCWPLQCLISALTQGGGGGHAFRLTCLVVLWGGRRAANIYPWHVLAVSGPHWVCPRSWHVCFPVYTAQAPGCSAGNCLRPALACMHFPGLSRSGSGSRVLHKGARVLYPSQARAAQVARCLASAVAATYPFSRPSRRVFWVYKERAFSGGPCVSSGELISGCDPPGGCQPSRIPRSLG